MSIAAIAAIMLFNLVLMVTGACLLWGIRGWESWGELLRLLGLAYLTAVCCFGVVLVNALVIGVPFGWLTLAGLLASLAAGGLVVGRLLDRRLPQLPRIRPIRRPRHTAPPTWIGTLGVSGLVLYLEATFRAGRIAPLQEWDAIAFWIPKAEAILTFGGLDERFFSTLPGPSYSPQVPALVASTFRFIGHPDPITIHLQFWFLFVGFMAAVAGLLAPRVRPLFLWPPLLLVALAPEMVTNVLLVQADKLLDYFVALGLILIALWLVDRQPWQLVLAGAFLSGAMLTKREGFLLVACLIAAALVASWSHKRETWPQLLGTAAIAFALTRPWHHWFASRGIASDDGQEGPALGYLGFVRHPERIWPSLRLTLETLFASDVWLLVTPLVIVAVLAAALVGSRLLALYAGSFLLFGMLACSWVTATTESGTLRPIVRLTGGLMLPMAGLLPLLLHAVWARAGSPPALDRIQRALPGPPRRAAALGLIAVAALGYPVAVLAGGGPPFPTRADCSASATADGDLELVLGTFDSFTEAVPFAEKVKKMGFIHAEPHANGCGQVEVGVPEYPTLAGAEDAAGEARRAGLEPSVQRR